MVVDNDDVFYLFDYNRKELERVSGREVILPIIHVNELQKRSKMAVIPTNHKIIHSMHQKFIIDEDHGTEEPLPFDEPELQPEDVRGQLLSVYFNPNLAHYIGLPVEAASYKVLVQIGEFKSNVVDVKVLNKN